MNEDSHFQDGLNLLDGRRVTGNEALRAAVLAQTIRIVRRRRILRRVAFVGGLAACYLAGLVTTWAALSGSGSARDTVQAAKTSRSALPTGPSPSEQGAASKAGISATALEWRAFDSHERRRELFRQAGDRYLQQAGDLKSAVRCYRQSLQGALASDLTIKPDDSWLLMALKQAKQKEKQNASSKG
jgi:hypothetical protein